MGPSSPWNYFLEAKQPKRAPDKLQGPQRKTQNVELLASYGMGHEPLECGARADTSFDGIYTACHTGLVAHQQAWTLRMRVRVNMTIGMPGS